ncbi:MAG: hypothetical protein ACOC22_02875 [bacterium]
MYKYKCPECGGIFTKEEWEESDKGYYGHPTPFKEKLIYGGGYQSKCPNCRPVYSIYITPVKSDDFKNKYFCLEYNS